MFCTIFVVLNIFRDDTHKTERVHKTEQAHKTEQESLAKLTAFRTKANQIKLLLTQMSKCKSNTFEIQQKLGYTHPSTRAKKLVKKIVVLHSY